MSKKGKKKNQDKIAAKKAAVLGTEKKSRLPLFVAVIGAVLIVAGAVFYVNQGGRVQSATAAAPSAAGSTFVSFPVSLFEDKSSDGVLRAAFDACDVCWPAGKGYYQEGDNMVCRNCGRRFASVRVNEVKGGCNPAPLNRSVQNGKLVIQVKDILEGKQYFNFAGKV
jgi:uncharacterized membrane protein